MKKKSMLFAIILIAIAMIIITCVSCNNEEEPIGGVEPTKYCEINNFQQLNKVFPKKLKLPKDCGDETIYVINSEIITVKNDVKHNIALHNLVDTLVAGLWQKEYTDYTIQVNFYISKNWVPTEEFLKDNIEEELFGYQAFQSFDKKQLYFIDKENDIYYAISISEVFELNAEESDVILRNYIKTILRIE